MQGKLTVLKNTSGETVFPVTSSEAVMSSDGTTTLEQKINTVSDKTVILNQEVENAKSLMAQKINFTVDSTSNVEIPQIDEKLNSINNKYETVASQLEQSNNHSSGWVNIAEFKNYVVDDCWDNAFIECLKISNNILIDETLNSLNFNNAITINKDNVNIKSTNEVIGGNIKLKFLNDTSAFKIDNNTRFIKLKNLTIETVSSSTKAGLDFSLISTKTGGHHMSSYEGLIINNFNKAIEQPKDGQSFMWNVEFSDIRTNNCNIGVELQVSNLINFGLVFKRFYTNNSNKPLILNGASAEFNSCNFGITKVGAISTGINSTINFKNCNFECDSFVNEGSSIISISSHGAKFDECSFIANANEGISFIRTYDGVKYCTFSNCTYKVTPTNLSTAFISTESKCDKYAIKYIGGCSSLPRPSFPYSNQYHYFVDVENNVLPKINKSLNIATVQGEYGYSYSDKMPFFFNGTNNCDFLGNILDDVTFPVKLSNNKILDYGTVKLPTTGTVKIEFNNKKFSPVFLSIPLTTDIIHVSIISADNTGATLQAKRWDESSKTFVNTLSSELTIGWCKVVSI